jgi:hypothetical protein
MLERDNHSRRSADPVVASAASHRGPDMRSSTAQRVRKVTSLDGSRERTTTWR